MIHLKYLLTGSLLLGLFTGIAIGLLYFVFWYPEYFIGVFLITVVLTLAYDIGKTY